MDADLSNGKLRFSIEMKLYEFGDVYKKPLERISTLCSLFICQFVICGNREKFKKTD